jgi:cytochrome c biogenesis protein CcmG/thiol:disulfide interchange protein DsbE
MEDSVLYLDTSEQTAEWRLSWTAVAFLIATVVFIIFLGVSLSRVGQTQPTSGPAPDFTLRTFEGDAFSLADQRGKVVIINFWASWCEPCRDEAPILQDVWERYRDRGVAMVGVAYLDVERDSLAYIEEFGLTYPHGLDVGKAISDQYKIQGVPETFIVDQEGNIVKLYIGPVVEGQLDAILDRLLET